MTTSQTTEPTTEETKPRIDLYQKVTDTIVQQLEAGTVPWHRPWTGSDNRLLEIPYNGFTQNRYRGINIVLLWCTSIAKQYPSSEWASFKQWKDKKESIRKDEKGSMIVYYDTFEKEIDGEVQQIPFLKSSIVFNRCQLQSYQPEDTGSATENPLLVEKVARIDTFVENTGAAIGHIGSSARYVPADDVIYMPEPAKFIDQPTCTATEGYYSTLLHELGHWTGTPVRLNRQFGKKFGDHAYATEELVAEFTAAFLCSNFGIATMEKGDHAAYINHWLKVLKDNKYCLIAAASEGSKAVDYLYSFQ